MARCLRRLGALITCVTLAACGSGSGSGSSSAGQAPSQDQTQAPPQTTPELAALTPASLSFDLAADTSGELTMAFSNAGDASLTYSLASTAAWLSLPSAGSVPSGGTVNLSVSAACGPVALSGDIVLTTNDEDEGTVLIPVTANCTAPDPSVTIERVLLNQAARAYDSDVASTPTIRVLAGRETLVRAFVTTADGPGAVIPDGRVIVTAADASEQSYPMTAPSSIGASAGADSVLAANYYTALPPDALTAGASLRVEVGSGAGAARFPTGDDIDINPVDAGAFRITFVPVTFEGQTPTIDVNDSMRQALQVLPIGEYDVEIRTPYTFSGAYDLDTLLTEISDLRDLDGSDRLYHAIIIPPGGSSSGTAGIGYVGYPVSVSIDLGGDFFIIAHELGHNLDLDHAPGCGAPGPDVNFPNATGEVSAWGYDIQANALVTPSPTRFDFMSYCNDLWVSDYHFDRAIGHRDQSAIGFRVMDGPGLSVTGRIGATGLTDLQLLPTPRQVARAMHGESTHRFRAWDASGSLLIDLPFMLHAIEDGPVAYGRFAFSVARPDATIHHYEVSHAGGTVVASATLAEPGSGARVIEVDSRSGTPRIAWQPSQNDALIVRDGQGRVIAVDRTGALALRADANAAEMTLLTRDGPVGHLAVHAGGMRRETLYAQ